MKNAPALTRALALAGAIIAADRASKWFVVEHLGLKSLGEMSLSTVFNLRMAWNTGVNFGVLAGHGDMVRWALVAVAVVASAALCLWTARAGRPAVSVGAGLIVGGAIGNAWDRVTYGAVADFLNVTCCGFYNPWAFNVADIAIFAGVGVLLLFDRPDGASAPERPESRGK